MMTHNKAALIAAGFRLVSEQKDMPGIGLLRRVARTEDVSPDSVAAYRTASDVWGVFVLPNASAGFRDAPLIP